MVSFRTSLRRGFDRVERCLDLAFGTDWNPLAHLGSIGWFLFWVVVVTGVYLFVFFDTGVSAAYDSVRRLSTVHWWHAGLSRTLHRYASDLMVVVMFTHLIREFAMERYHGPRWFSWVTGVPIIWFVYLSGITGYWLIWDKLAQYVAITTTELVDTLGFLGQPIARNFLSPDMLSNRFFTLMVFLHIAIPLILLMLMWIHTQRITEARTHPPKGLAFIIIVALVTASLVIPAPMQAAADLRTVPQSINIDWLLLGLYPLVEMVPSGVIWGGIAAFTLLLIGMPWIPANSGDRPAEVFLEHCNGCERCVQDCPYEAITLEPRSDGAHFRFEVAVNSRKCVACGICMGACPSSSPFRRKGDLITGIDLPDYSLAKLHDRIIEVSESPSAQVGSSRVLTLACSHGAGGQPAVARVEVPCVAMVPPSMVDFIISRGLADGVCLVGCAARECHNRLGKKWTMLRLAQQRDPYLRARIPRERVLTVWAGPTEENYLESEIDAFAARLNEMPGYENVRQMVRKDIAKASNFVSSERGKK